jgi:hypothetical protein
MTAQNPERGETVILNRAELAQIVPEGLEEVEKGMMFFAQRLALDPNIVGFALSNMSDGGLYTHFFVQAVIGSKVEEDAMRATMITTDEAFQLLGKSSGRRVGYCSFMHLGRKSFDNIERKFRADWDVGEPDNPFHPYANSAELDLLAVIKFE